MTTTNDDPLAGVRGKNVPTCPQCQRVLQEVPRRSNWLNDDQYAAVKAGDWWCDHCPDNGRGQTGLCYWYDSEVEIASPTKASDALATALSRLDDYIQDPGRWSGVSVHSLAIDAREALMVLEQQTRDLSAKLDAAEVQIGMLRTHRWVEARAAREAEDDNENLQAKVERLRACFWAEVTDPNAAERKYLEPGDL